MRITNHVRKKTTKMKLPDCKQVAQFCELLQLRPELAALATEGVNELETHKLTPRSADAVDGWFSVERSGNQTASGLFWRRPFGKTGRSVWL